MFKRLMAPEMEQVGRPTSHAPSTERLASNFGRSKIQNLSGSMFMNYTNCANKEVADPSPHSLDTITKLGHQAFAGSISMVLVQLLGGMGRLLSW